MKGVVWITEGTSLVRGAVQHLRSLSESEKRLCSIADTEAFSFQDLVRRLPHITFLDLTTQTDAPDDAWEEEITGWDPRSTRDPSSSSSFWPHQSDATSRLRQAKQFHQMFLWPRLNGKIQCRQLPCVAFCSNVLQIRWTVWNLRNVPEVMMMILLHFVRLIIMIWRMCQKF